MTSTDHARQAAQVGLEYVSDEEPGVRRRRRGAGFSYAHEDGRAVESDRERERIRGLAIPPAWTDVWICPSPNGHLQATGRDAKGRKQYLYHPDWVDVRREANFDRMYDFGRKLIKIRKRTAEHLGLKGLPRERVLALVAQLMDETLIRVGNSQYATRNSTYGLTTLRSRHVEVDGDLITFSFEAKNSTATELTVANPDLAPLVAKCADLGGDELFAYSDGDEIVDVGSDDVNDYLRHISGFDLTAKDFRTWGASAAVVRHLAETELGDSNGADAFLAAVDAAADLLNNTRSVARNSYVHPMLEDAFASGSICETWRKSRRGRWYERPEKTFLKLLAE